MRFRAMNTNIEAVLYGSDEDNHHEYKSIYNWFHKVEQTFSRFLPDSECSKLNLTSGKLCLVSEPMLEVLLLAEQYRAKTDGVFNIFLLNALQQAGYRESFERLNGERADVSVEDGPQAGIDEPIFIDAVMKSVRLPSGAKMDLGGIVKGWSVRRISEWLQHNRHITRGIVNAGGDLAVWGGAGESGPWTVGIEHPWRQDEEIGLLSLYKGSAATSSTLGRQWQTERGAMHHLIDPRTMKPSQSDVVQCTVSGADVLECEIWAKVICITGSEDGIERLQRYTAGYEAVLFTKDRKVIFCGNKDSLAVKWGGLAADRIIEPVSFPHSPDLE